MMVYQEEQLRVKRQSSKQAIALAMQGRWQEAIGANLSILEAFPEDVDAYNRLGRAYMELGGYLEAKNAYQRAIDLDPYNAIARKNISRLSNIDEMGAPAEEHPHNVEPQFIEEAGKSGVVNLIRLASPKTLVRMVAGDKVYLKMEESNLVIKSGRGEYLGQIEPKHAPRLIRLIKGGNRYSAAVINATETKVTVIIREVYQSPGQAGQPSFPSRWVEEIRTFTASDRGIRHLEDEEDIDEGAVLTDEAEPSPEGFSRGFDETDDGED